MNLLQKILNYVIDNVVPDPTAHMKAIRLGNVRREIQPGDLAVRMAASAAKYDRRRTKIALTSHER